MLYCAVKSIVRYITPENLNMTQDYSQRPLVELLSNIRVMAKVSTTVPECGTADLVQLTVSADSQPDYLCALDNVQEIVAALNRVDVLTLQYEAASTVINCRTFGDTIDNYYGQE